MVDPNTETVYYVRCSMGIGQDSYLTGYARDEEGLKEMVAKMKKTWRHVDVSTYQAAKCNAPQSKRKKK